MSTGYSDFNIVTQSMVDPESTVVLVGAALDGPANIPFTLHSDKNPFTALGQSPLADAYNAAKRAGAENIIAYRLNGVHSEAVLKDKNDKEIISFRSVSASSIYNGIELYAYPTHLHVVRTDGVARSYFFDRYKKASDLVYAINRDAYYGLVEFNATSIDEYYVLENMVDTVTNVAFTGGSEEVEYINRRDPQGEAPTNAPSVVALLKERLKVALFGEDELDILERQPSSELGALEYGVITLCDMYHDDDPEITEMLGSFCMNKTKETGFGSIGVIGTKPIFTQVLDAPDLETDDGTDLEELVETEDFNTTVHNRVLELASLTESLEDKEAFKYVQVIVGHAGYPESMESSISIAYAYAATQAISLYYTMMSNKQINGLGKLNFELSKEDVALLTANGYICIVPSIRRGFVPFYATSYSKDKESVMAKPHHLRISQYVSRMLVEKLDSLIGSNYSPLSIKEAVDAAREVLSGLVVEEVVREYTLDYELTDGNTVLNINASLTPFSEVKAVGAIAVISFPQGVSI